MIHRWKHLNKTQHIIGICQGFAEIADGLVTLCSLGFYMSSFELSVSRFRARQAIKSLKNNP